MLIVGCSYSWKAQRLTSPEETRAAMEACGCVRCMNACSKPDVPATTLEKQMNHYALVFVRLEDALNSCAFMPKQGDIYIRFVHGSTDASAIRGAEISAGFVCDIIREKMKAVIEEVPDLKRTSDIPTKLYLAVGTSLDTREGYDRSDDLDLTHFGATEVRFVWADSPLDALSMCLPSLNLEMMAGTLEEVRREVLLQHQLAIHAVEVPV